MYYRKEDVKKIINEIYEIRNKNIFNRYIELICQGKDYFSAINILCSETGYSWEYIRKIISHYDKKKD